MTDKNCMQKDNRNHEVQLAEIRRDGISFV